MHYNIITIVGCHDFELLRATMIHAVQITEIEHAVAYTLTQPRVLSLKFIFTFKLPCKANICVQ